jgi:hypothetical protein
MASAAPAWAQSPAASPQPQPSPPPSASGVEVPTPEETSPAAANAPTPDAPPLAARQASRTYQPADFARFAPRTALDMLNNVPGFSIDAGDTSRRGLGQATGNVLINGQRFTGRSTDIITELGRISATNVVRIEIVDGATTNISGLTGQVANVITASRGLSGSFAWRPQIRRDRTPARLLDGEVTINGTLGGTQYTLGLRNVSRRNGNAGPEIVTTPAGLVLDRRDEMLFVNEDGPRISGSIRRNFSDGSILNANAAFALFNLDVGEDSLRSGPSQPDRNRTLREREREFNYELGGDYEFGLGGGRLKLIGVHRFEHSPYTQTLDIIYSDGRPRDGQRFTQTADETESILRGEYRWTGGRNEWQASLEGALNRLDIANNLFVLNPAGTFLPVVGAATESVVEERRAEATITFSRPLSSTLTLQAAAGAEYSELTQTGAGGLSRQFVRPKGFVNLAWRSSSDLDVSFRVERAVDQLNFFDFVASSNVSAGTANAGNANLVPPQRWNAQIQARRNLGPWGTVTGRLYGSLITDIVDVIPIGATGQSPGNLPGSSMIYGFQLISTINFDPIGWRGAKLDANLQFQGSSLEDPLTGLRRPFNERMTSQMELTLRHDIPNTQLAWGLTGFRYRQSAGYRLDQRFRFLDTPGSLGAFVEHKDMFGLTVRASVDNLLGTNESFSRTFFDERRNATNSNALFTEYRDRFYGPVFTLSISGTI